MEKPYLKVEIPNGEIWHIPCHVIAKDRAKYYAKKEADSLKDSCDYDTVCKEIFDDQYAYTLKSDTELLDWANNNMDWADVQHHAEKQPPKPAKPDYGHMWIGSEKDICR